MIFSTEKIEMFFFTSPNRTELNVTMVDPEHHARARAAPVPAPVPAPVRPANVWDEYERITDEWNQCPEVQTLYHNRNQMINNTPAYHTGNNILHIRSIQMYRAADWNALFGAENLSPILREYAQASIEYAQDETGTVPYAGQMEVSLVMQENYRGNIHRAIFMVHQTINRLFDPNARAVVLQATQYQFLEYIVDDNDAREILNDYFMDPDFTSMRFSYVADPEHDNDGYYVMSPNALDNHQLHYCAQEDDNHRLPQHQHQHQHQHQEEPNEPVIAIPPPPPIYDIGEIYQRNLEMNYYYDDEVEEDNDHNIIRHNNNNAAHDDDDHDQEIRYPVQG